ncbi:MAG: hypothetical protein JXP73_09225 [Deltaproteobacteria bacterium]|nr:hypothetical protein [Deltaproteobacteria bacterium]
MFSNTIWNWPTIAWVAVVVGILVLGVVISAMEKRRQETEAERANALARHGQEEHEHARPLLAPCPSCKREISTAAVACPHCGQPLVSQRPYILAQQKPDTHVRNPVALGFGFGCGWFLFGLLLLVVLVIAGCIFGLAPCFLLGLGSR